MELDWTTFLLEIVNFLILVWLLSHFLYQPVLAILQRRRETIARQLEDAQSTRAEADTLKQRYSSRLDDWEQEKAEARQALAREINDQRTRQQQALAQEREQTRSKERLLAQRQLREEQRLNEIQALRQGAAFCARLLGRLASPALEATLIEMVTEDLQQLRGKPRTTLLRAFRRQQQEGIRIASAFPLSQQQQQALRQAFADLLEASPRCTFAEEPQLLAGVRIQLGDWILKANLQDELKAFAEASHGEH